MASVRERLKEISRVLLPGNISPGHARAALMTLTGLLEPCMETVRERERIYRTVLAECMGRYKTKAAAEIEAQSTSAYNDFREAEDAKELVDQMLITCRGYLRSLDEEMRLAR